VHSSSGILQDDSEELMALSLGCKEGLAAALALELRLSSQLPLFSILGGGANWHRFDVHLGGGGLNSLADKCDMLALLFIAWVTHTGDTLGVSVRGAGRDGLTEAEAEVTLDEDVDLATPSISFLLEGDKA